MEQLFRIELNLKRIEVADVLPGRVDVGHVRRLTDADIDVVTAAHRDKGLVRRRLDKGYIAYWVEIDGACVQVMWLATKRYFVWDIRADILLPPDSVYLFDAFTVPEFRRKGLTNMCTYKCFQSLKDEGIRKAYVLIHTDNVPANIQTERTGFELLGLVSLLQIPPVRKYMIRLADGQRRHMFHLMKIRTKPALLNVDELIFGRQTET